MTDGVLKRGIGASGAAVTALALTVIPARGEKLGTDGFADSGGVKIHYVTAGKGDLVVLIHGFPDFWYSWRHQIPALAEHFQVVAVDQRGYNKSDKPDGVENYTMDKLIGDVVAVVKHFKRDKAVIVGHDWGGAVAWGIAMNHPEMTDRLVILNLPHPKGFTRELANNSTQRTNSQYARNSQQPDAAKKVSPEGLSKFIRDEAARPKYLEAFERSSIEGMLNYYKANYPRPPYEYDETRAYPPVQCPVLMFHGLDDAALLPGALNDTWNWIEKDLTLITVPGAGHWVHHDAADRVTDNMVRWLTASSSGAKKNPSTTKTVTPAEPPVKRKPIPDRATLEKKLAETLTDAVLVGSWQMATGDGDLGEFKTEKYSIRKAVKGPDDSWTIFARIQYGPHDVTLPIRLRILWAEDTPIIMVDETVIPGIGTYSARVMIYDRFYSGTWSGKGYGGILAGQIKKASEAKAHDATEGKKQKDE